MTHLVHVGFPKAGATFFKAWCASRDDVAFRHGAMGGYLSTEALITEAAGRERPPAVAVTSDEGFAGAPRLWASLWQQAFLPDADLQATAREVTEWIPTVRRRVAEHLAALYPDATVLLLTRGFDSMLRSSYSQYLKLGGTLSFEVFAFGAADAEEPTPAFVSAWRTWLGFDAILETYEQTFGADRVVALPYERLRDDRPAYVAALAEVAGIEPRPFDPGRVNPSLSQKALLLAPRLSRAVFGVSQALPGPVRRRVQRRYQRALLGQKLPRLLDRTPGVREPAPLTAPPALLAHLGGLADALCERPAYAPYRAAYLCAPDP